MIISCFIYLCMVWHYPPCITVCLFVCLFKKKELISNSSPLLTVQMTLESHITSLSLIFLIYEIIRLSHNIVERMKQHKMCQVPSTEFIKWRMISKRILPFLLSCSMDVFSGIQASHHIETKQNRMKPLYKHHSITSKSYIMIFFVIKTTVDGPYHHSLHPFI